MDTESNRTESSTNESLSFDFIGVLRRRWLWLALSCVAGLGVGSAYFFLSAKRYESTAELLVMQNDSGSMAVGTSNVERTVSEELLATHMKILQSDSIVAAAIQKHGFDQLPSVIANVNEKTSAVEYIQKNLSVTTGGSGRARLAHVLNVGFRHTETDECQPILSAVIEEYQAFTKAQFQDINVEAANLIRDARIELEEEISKLDTKYKDFRATSPLMSRGKESNIYAMRYEQLASELSQLETSRDEAAARLEMVKSGLADFKDSKAHSLNKLALIDERNAERLGILVTVERGKAETAAFQSMQPARMAGATAEYSSLLTMKSRLKELSEDFGPEYPEARSLNQQIREMEDFLNRKSRSLVVGEDDMNLTPDDVMEAYVTMLAHDLQSLERRINDVTKQLATAESEAKALVAYELEDASIVRERERQNELYSAVIERLKNINMQREQVPLIQQMIQEPTLAKKVEPKGTIAAAVSMIVAIALGGVGAVLLEFRDATVRSHVEVERLLGSEVLSHLPTFQKDATIRKSLREAKKSKSPLSETLLVHFAPSSRASESFRALRTQLSFAVGSAHRIVAITSCGQGAGKSMLASNLSISLAGLGQKVLLVDCDMRLPQVHKLFGLPNDKGLAESIVRPSDVNSFIRRSEVEGLDLLTSGTASINPAELLTRPGFEELLAQFREDYAFVILDCPPVLAVSDPLILAPLTDGILFVTSANKERAPALSRARKLLDGVKAKIIGVVVNRSDSTTSSYGGADYGYGYVSSGNYYKDSVPS